MISPEVDNLSDILVKEFGLDKHQAIVKACTILEAMRLKGWEIVEKS